MYACACLVYSCSEITLLCVHHLLFVLILLDILCCFNLFPFWMVVKCGGGGGGVGSGAGFAAVARLKQWFE